MPLLCILRGFTANPSFVRAPSTHAVRNGTAVFLPCHTNTAASSCEWIAPYDAVFVPSTEDNFYRLVGNLSQGDCTLQIVDFRSHDEGPWQCSVNTVGRKLVSQPAVLALTDLTGFAGT